MYKVEDDHVEYKGGEDEEERRPYEKCAERCEDFESRKDDAEEGEEERKEAESCSWWIVILFLFLRKKKVLEERKMDDMSSSDAIPTHRWDVVSVPSLGGISLKIQH